jgi:hypothetical protein
MVLKDKAELLGPRVNDEIKKSPSRGATGREFVRSGKTHPVSFLSFGSFGRVGLQQSGGWSKVTEW